MVLKSHPLMRRLALLVLLASLGGCTAINGMQTPIADADLKKSLCPSAQDMSDFLGSSGTARGAVRDKVILDCVKAINRNYIAFKSLLHKDAVDSNLIPDVLGLGLNGAATLTKGNTAKQFSQAALVALGVGAAVNKDVFYQQTLPAIESAMDTTRDAILKTIVDSEKSDPDGSKYTLANAGFDLDAYEAAGNIYAAISQLTTTANKAAQAAHDDLVKAQQSAPILLTELPSDIDARLTKLIRFVWSLKSEKDQATLNQVATKLNFGTVAKETFADEQRRIVDQLDRATHAAADPTAQMTRYEAALTGIYTP